MISVSEQMTTRTLSTADSAARAESPGRPTGAATAPEAGVSANDKHVLWIAPPFPSDVLAVGADLKNRCCAGHGSIAELSRLCSDLADADDYRRFLSAVSNLRRHLGPKVVIACDLHPTYVATRFARAQKSPVIAVQHHFAHATSCAAEAGLAPPFLAVVCDGTGYGPDGAFWGGEVLHCGSTTFERKAHLDQFGLPGGDAAARQTWRPAMAVLLASADQRGTLPTNDLPCWTGVDPQSRASTRSGPQHATKPQRRTPL